MAKLCPSAVMVQRDSKVSNRNQRRVRRRRCFTLGKQLLANFVSDFKHLIRIARHPMPRLRSVNEPTAKVGELDTPCVIALDYHISPSIQARTWLGRKGFPIGSIRTWLELKKTVREIPIRIEPQRMRLVMVRAMASIIRTTPGLRNGASRIVRFRRRTTLNVGATIR